jgi:hypothetical protein
VRMARNEAKETIFQPCVFLRKALLSLSLVRCNPTFTDFELQLFLRRIGWMFLLPGARFFFEHYRQSKSLAKRNQTGCFSIKSKQNPTHNIILEILTKLPTSTGLPTSRAQQTWNCQGRQETVAFSVFRLAVNLTNTLDIIQSIRFNASRSENSSIHI